MTEQPSGIEAAALKPCPFCGSKSVAQGATGKQTISVWCMGCGTRGPDVPFPDFCDSVAQISLCHQRWNSRRPAASGDLRERIAQIVDPDAYNGRAGHHDMYPRRANAVAKADVILAMRKGRRLVPIKPTGQQMEQAAYNLADEFGPEYVLEHKAFALAAYEELVTAVAPPPGLDEEVIRKDERERCAEIADGFARKLRKDAARAREVGCDISDAGGTLDHYADLYEGIAAAIRSLKTGSGE